jgi:hypothetical protein
MGSILDHMTCVHEAARARIILFSLSAMYRKFESVREVFFMAARPVGLLKYDNLQLQSFRISNVIIKH